MSVLPLAETPPLDVCCDREVHLSPQEFRTAVDPALRDRCPATPETVHIAPKRRTP